MGRAFSFALNKVDVMNIEHIECESPAVAMSTVCELLKRGIYAYVLQGSTVSIHGPSHA